VLDAWTRLCVRHADSVVDVIGPERPSAPIRDTWADDWQARDLLRIVDTSTPWSTSEVLATRGYRAVHHARPAAATDMERLARLLRGTAHGLVLSGGSAKGTAHIGVALALREAGLAPDFVTGTSAGALIGAMVASQWSEQQMRDAVYRLAAFPAWRELHPPFGSLLSGRQMRRLLVDLFGTTEVDETWLPFEPVAADLVSGAAVVPRSTTVRRAVQASTALPALWPPVPYGAQLLIDGGTVNNLPVDRAISPCGRGTITASDVATSVLSMSPTADELPTGWETLRARLSRRSLQGPALVDVLTRAGSLASATAQSRSSSAVTRRIAPDVEPPAGLSARAQVDWLIESGRAATQRVLDAEC
jgi:NTE family protein